MTVQRQQHHNKPNDTQLNSFSSDEFAAASDLERTAVTEAEGRETLRHYAGVWRSAGFSLTEMLATVLIMSLVTLAIAGGITTAVRVYRQITLKADAQTLLATSIAALNTDLASADISGLAVQKDADGNPVENDHTYTPSGDSMKFYSVDRGYAVNIHNGEGDQAGQIMVTDSIPLVSARTRTFDLHNQIVFNEYPDTEKASTPQHFTYTITIYSGEDTNNTVAEQKVTVNNIFY